MKKISIAFVALAFVLASAGVGHARAAGGGHGGRGGQGGGHAGAHFGGHGGGHFAGRPAFQPHPGFPGPRGGFVPHRGFVGHRHFHRGGPGVFVGVAPFVIGGAYAYGWPYDPGYAAPAPEYSAPAPSYWYYCQSAGAYYPDVPSCPEPWVPVPAQ